MQRAETLLSIIQKRGERGLPLRNVYRLLFNPDLYLHAYGKIYQIWAARPLTPLHALLSTLAHILTKNEKPFVLDSVAYLWKK